MSEPEAGSDLASLRCAAVARRRRLRGQRPEDVELATATAPTGASSTCAPTPTCPSTRASPACSSTCARPASRPARSRRWRATTASASCSSPTSACRASAAARRGRRGLERRHPHAEQRAGRRRQPLPDAARQARPAARRRCPTLDPVAPRRRSSAATSRCASSSSSPSARSAPRCSGRAPGPGGQRDQAGLVASPTRRWPTPPSTSSAWTPSSGGWATNLLGSRSLTIAGGTTEVNRNIIGERVLGLPKEPG